MPVTPPPTPPAIAPNYWSYSTLSYNRSLAFPSNPEFRNVFANDIQVYDVNGDGHLDVVQIYSYIPNQNIPAIPIRVMLGDGRGGFSEGTASLFGSNVPVGDAASGTTVADFNGDGRRDLFISQAGYDQPPFPGYQNQLVLSSGVSGVVNATATNLPQIRDFTHWSTAGDINGDGDNDILVLNLGAVDNNRDVYFLLNNGSGSFTRSDALLPAIIDNGTRQYQSALLFDADNDGDVDLFLGVWGPQAAFLNSGAFQSLVLFNDGTGRFLQTAASDLPDSTWAPSIRNALGVQAADITGDGFKDLLVVMDNNAGTNYIQVLINNGAGSFIDETTARFAVPAQPGTRYFHMVDVNADGSLDVIYQTGGASRFYLNDGAGHFIKLPADFLFTNGGNDAFLPGDFNEDGRLDFFIRNFVNAADDPNNVTEFDTIALWTQPAGLTLNGDGAANAVLGAGVAETLNGLGGDDVIFAAQGDDVVTGGPGDDYINGGTGLDVAVFTGSAASYSWSRQPSGAWTVRDTRVDSPDGVDLVANVEKLKFADQTVTLAPVLPTPVESAFANILRAGSSDASNLVLATDASFRISVGAMTTSGAIAEVVKAAGATTSVATLAYQFFTGKIPSGLGIDYLVSPTGPNPNNLNSAYYQSFSLENRYINFAVNLGKLGEGKDAFAAAFGAKSLAEATRDAYAKIFGTVPTDAKVSALLDPSFVLNGQTLTRAEYFAFYGQDGLTGIGTKAAMVGWLLGEAVKADIGTYAKSNDAFLLDLADGATFAVDLVGVYGKPEFALTT